MQCLCLGNCLVYTVVQTRRLLVGVHPREARRGPRGAGVSSPPGNLCTQGSTVGRPRHAVHTRTLESRFLCCTYIHGCFLFTVVAATIFFLLFPRGEKNQSQAEFASIGLVDMFNAGGAVVTEELLPPVSAPAVSLVSGNGEIAGVAMMVS